jgi:DNA-binding MarR family transcriptional regulator
MLQKRHPNTETGDAIRRYLHDTLGLRAVLRPWAGAAKLPYFLQEAFAIRQLTLHGHDVLLALDHRPHRPKLVELRTQVERLRVAARLPVLYVTGALASWERKRLIDQRVPFLVPGNQLYLPDLGIDLREYFRHASTETGARLSPATQAVLIAMLLGTPWRNDWVPAEVVAQLGYTPMTLTRVLRELAAAGLADIKRRGRERHLHIDGTAPALWERARKVMRSPVKRSVWVHTTGRRPPALPLAGLSALAHLTPMADPPWPVYALGPTEWRNTTEDAIELLPQPAEGCSEWQLWSYSPARTRGARTVDPLSLTLSLEPGADERVQMALDALRKRFPW